MSTQSEYQTPSTFAQGAPSDGCCNTSNLPTTCSTWNEAMFTIRRGRYTVLYKTSFTGLDILFIYRMHRVIWQLCCLCHCGSTYERGFLSNTQCRLFLVFGWHSSMQHDSCLFFTIVERYVWRLCCTWG